MARWSMTRRLVGTLTMALSALWLVAAGASALSAYHEINEVFDDALQQAARRLVPLVLDDIDLRGGEAAFAAVPPADDDRGDGDRDDDDGNDDDGARAGGEHDDDTGEQDGIEDAYLLFQVFSDDGTVLMRSHDAPVAPFGAPLAPGFASTAEFRIYSASAPGGVFVQVAQPLGQRWEVVAGSLAWLLLPLLVLVPIAGGTIWWTVRRIRQPLAALRHAVRARGGTNLAALPDAGLPDELAPIVADVNRLLERLQAALEGERALAANAAHELRTPVAAALAQAQRLASRLADSEEADRAAQIVATLGRMSRLTEKLLQLARAEAGVALDAGRMDLMPVLRLLAEEYGRRPEAAGRLTFDAAGRDVVWVWADPDAAGIAVQNLLDNALAHGAPDGPVVLTVGADGGIHVVNDGTALPADVLSGLVLRFERAGATALGSGLGLTIVDTIMRQSGGSLTLLSPATGRKSGFEAVLRFRPADAA